MSTILNVECVDQDLFITNSPTLASGGICENLVSFKFCSKWDGFTKTAVFYQNEKNVYYSLIDDKNTCEIPFEVTIKEGTLYIGVFGVQGDVRRTSKIDKIRIHKGAWSKEMHPSDPTPDIYTQILSGVSEVNNLLHDLLNGTSTTPVGNAKTLEGHGASYFASQTALDTIQTTSRATLSQAGWYRVAEYESFTAGLQGGASNSVELLLKRSFGDANTEQHHLLVSSTYGSQEIKSLNSKSKQQIITKARYTYDSAKAYVEIYYSLNSSNPILVEISHSADYIRTWKAITPTLTAETVDGVTVTTTYDIPANATPVNSVNLADAMENFSYSVVTVSSDTELSTALATLHNESTNVSTYERSIKFQYSHAKLGGGYGTIRGFRQDANYGHQIIEKRNSTNTPVIAIRYLNNGVYSDWFYNATTADLGNYLPSTGGTVKGNFKQVLDSADAISRTFKNSLRNIQEYLNTSGVYILADATNSKEIIKSTKDSTNTFNGTATGNLPLDGGGTVQKAYIIPLTLENTLADQCFVALKGPSGSLGALGVSDNLPVFADNKSNFYTLLHAGNYGDYNNFYKGLSVTDASGEEGGEIRWAQPQTDHAFDSMITQDIWRDIMRIHAMHDGVSKLFHIDFSSMKEGVNEALHTGNSAKVTITDSKDDVPDTMDGLWAY